MTANEAANIILMTTTNSKYGNTYKFMIIKNQTILVMSVLLLNCASTKTSTQSPYASVLNGKWERVVSDCIDSKTGSTPDYKSWDPNLHGSDRLSIENGKVESELEIGDKVNCIVISDSFWEIKKDTYRVESGNFKQDDCFKRSGISPEVFLSGIEHKYEISGEKLRLYTDFSKANSKALAKKFKPQCPGVAIDTYKRI